MGSNNKTSRWLSYGSALLGVMLSLIPLSFGVGLMRDWLRVKRDPGASFNYEYLLFGMVWVLAASIGLIPVVYASFKSAPSKFLSAWAVAVGLTSAYLTPEFNPQTSMLTAATGATREIEQNLIAWDGIHGRYPMDANELADAVGSEFLSERPVFRRQGKAIPYRLRFVPNATGPYEYQDVDEPGMLVYAVSSNFREFWLTMTTLDKPVGGRTVFLRAPGAGGALWVKSRIHRDGDASLK